MASLRGSAAFSDEIPDVGPAQNASRNPVRISHHPSGIRYMLTGNICGSLGVQRHNGAVPAQSGSQSRSLRVHQHGPWYSRLVALGPAGAPGAQRPCG
eukprot:16079254-Heterocapsa_arctica.AAC.1